MRLEDWVFQPPALKWCAIKVVHESGSVETHCRGRLMPDGDTMIEAAPPEPERCGACLREAKR